MESRQDSDPHGEEQGQTVFLRERRARRACDGLVQLLAEEEA